MGLRRGSFTCVGWQVTVCAHWLLMSPADNTPPLSQPSSAGCSASPVHHILAVGPSLLRALWHGMRAAWRRPRSGAGMQHISTCPKDIFVLEVIVFERVRGVSRLRAIQIYNCHRHWHLIWQVTPPSSGMGFFPWRAIFIICSFNLNLYHGCKLGAIYNVGLYHEFHVNLHSNC